MDEVPSEPTPTPTSAPIPTPNKESPLPPKMGDGEVPLPPNWKQIVLEEGAPRPDQETTCFYWNPTTMDSRWTRPQEQPLAAGWSGVPDGAGRTYYWKEGTTEVTWREPKALPADWERRIDSELEEFGAFYWNSATNESTFDVPAVTKFSIRSIPVADLRAAGHTAKDLKAAGFSSGELKPAFSAGELKPAFSLGELKAAGFSGGELKPAFSLGELKEAAFSSEELKEAAFSSKELGAAGFSPEDVATAFNKRQMGNEDPAREIGQRVFCENKLGTITETRFTNTCKIQYDDGSKNTDSDHDGSGCLRFVPCENNKISTIPIPCYALDG